MSLVTTFSPNSEEMLSGGGGKKVQQLRHDDDVSRELANDEII